MYLALKHSHMTLVMLSCCLFLFRFGRYACCQRPAPRWLTIFPHIIDTLLLTSALSLVYYVGYALQSPWLLAKMVALLCYIGCGMVAMRGTGAKQWIGFALACVCFAYIVMVAVTKTPWGIF